MRYIKGFKLFESNWSPEEFVEEIRLQLSKYNVSSVEIRELIKRLDINSQIQQGKSPIEYSKELIDELNLSDRGTSRYPSHRVAKSWQSEIKYL